MRRFFASTIGNIADPVPLTLPVITGDNEIPNTLTATPGTWTGAPTLAYQWIRNGVDIPGETGLTYDTEAADNGAVITVREYDSTGTGTQISDVFLAGEGFFIPTDALGADPATDWVDISDGGNSSVVSGGVIKLLDNSSTTGYQTKLYTLGYPLIDDMILRYTVNIHQLNDISSWNPGNDDEVPVLAGETGDDPLNRVGFSFPIVHELLDLRAQIWFQKELDYGSTGNVGIWTVIDDAPNFIFRRLAVTNAIPIGSEFTYAVRTRLYSLNQYEMDMYIGNNIVLDGELIGMASDVLGNGSVAFQVKGTAAEPVEVDIIKVELFDMAITDSITFIEQSVVPADNGSNATTAISIPVPTLVNTGDLILVVWGDRQPVGTPTYSITNAANQSWTTMTGTVSSINWSYCTYNGNFGGATHIVVNSSTNLCTSGLLFVFRNPGGASSWTLDAALSEAVTASGTIHTISGVTVGSGNVLAIATFLLSNDLGLTWFGPSWKVPVSNQYRNTAGTDRAYGIGYKVMNGAGTTGIAGVSTGVIQTGAFGFSLKANP